MWAGNGTCGSATLSNSLSGASYNNSYVYTHLGQLWQGPLGGSGTQQQYLYCNSQPHELTGLYASGATCANQTGQVYASSYDSWGNVTSRTSSGTTSTLTYDLLDHFVSWNAGAQNKDLYVYDASGNRVLRRTTNSSATTLTVYPFGLEEHSYFNTGGHKGDLYYYTLGGRLLGALDNTGKTTFYLSDALGSVLASFSSAAGIAAIKGNQVFGPYGNARDAQGTINTAKGFTGQYNDSLTGLDYYGSRYYDQVAGVFLSADIVHGNSSGANPYAYVGGNPETYSDPTGQMFVPPGGGGSPGGVTNGGGSSSPSSMVQPVNAVLPTSTTAQGGSQPCLQIGCVSVLRAKVGFQATVNHFMSINLPTMVCDPFCFISIGDGQTIVTSTISGVTEAPFTHCGVSPFVCSDHGDTGVNGHDMPDVAPADTGGEPGNAGEIDSSSQGESGDLAVLPQNAKFAQKTYSARFSMQGIFNGRPVSEIAQELANGTLQPEDIPVQYINREDSTFILNTRSTVALILAGIDRSRWLAVDETGNALLEELLNGQLVRNNLTDVGVDSVIGPLGRIPLP